MTEPRFKILFIVSSMIKVASVRVAVDVATGLQEIGHEVSMIYFDSKAGDVFHPPFVTQQVDFLKRFDFSSYDVVHCHGFRPDLFYFLNTLIGRRAKISCNTFHNFIDRELKESFGRKSKIYGPIWKRLANNHTFTISLTKTAETHHKKLFKLHDSEVIYNGRDPNEFIAKNAVSLQSNEKKIGTISRIIDQKNLSSILRALPMLDNVHYYCVGDGPKLSELKELAKTLNVENKVTFTGNQTNPIEWYKAFDLALFPSHYEGFPLALIEAVMSETPCLVSDQPFFREIFSESEIVFVNAEDSTSFAEAISNELNDRRDTKPALDRALTAYTRSACVKNHLAAYRKYLVRAQIR